MNPVNPFLDLGAANAPIRDRLVEAAIRVIDSGRYIGGEECERFEAKLAASAGAACAVGLGNGLDALRLSLRALVELGRLALGDGVIVQGNAYIASVLAITDAGLSPVLVDVDSDMLPRTDQIAIAAREGARAFMPVHLYGVAAWNEAIRRAVVDNDLIVVEDNAQAIGAAAPVAGIGPSALTGSLGHVAAFSFYPTKNIGAIGDAGAITTDDPELAAAVRALGNYGCDRRYHNIYCGANSRLDPLQAALLSVKLDYLSEECDRRRALADIYQGSIANAAVTLPIMQPGNVWHQYVIRHPRRDELMEFLRRNGYATDIHYATPPHLQPCYRGRLDHGPLPATELYAQQMLSLPTGPNTTADHAHAIASLINQFDTSSK